MNRDPGFFAPDPFVDPHIQEHVDRILECQRKAIETYAAAFLANVGSAEALKYELIQEIIEPEINTKRESVLRYRWYFRRRIA